MERLKSPPAGDQIGHLISGAMREAVELSWDPAPGGASNASTADPGAAPLAPAMHAESFPGHQVLKRISAGGQAVVYLGVDDATGERVAIKAFRTQAAPTPRDRYRFEREVEALQGLCHPCITRILYADAGDASEGRRPYIVMEYIAGWNLDEYMREQELDVKGTMRLFWEIAGAIRAAHQKGVIHRDIKPSNIRVDHNGEPHVFDFGLAKIEASAPAEGTMTAAGEFLGTLYWVSPEQAEGRRQDVDVRTDVYSLGMVLYYMLTGELPFERGGSMREVLNRIVSAPPTPPTRWRREIDDDVETIVLKSLAKSPSRRYGSVGEVMEDVERWLEGRPILAKRDSLGYVAGKFVRRHWAPVAAGTAMVVLIVGATIVSGVLWQRARHEAEAARRERDRSEATTDFLRLALWGVRDQSPAEKELVKRLMDDAASESNLKRLAKTPETELALRHTIGNGYFRIGEYALAQEHFAAWVGLAARIYGPDDYRVANAKNQYADAVDADGRGFEALPTRREAVAIIRRQPDAPDEIKAEVIAKLSAGLSKLGHAEEALPLAEEAMQICRRPGFRNRMTLARALTIIGHAQADLDMGEQALANYTEVLEMCLQEPVGDANGNDLLGQSQGIVGRQYFTLDQGERALPLMMQGLHTWRKVYRDDHPYLVSVQWLLVGCLQSMGEHEEAARILESALRACQVLHPDDDDPQKAAYGASLAMALLTTGRCAEAVEYARQAAESARPHPAWRDHVRIVAEWALARSLLASGNGDEAVASARRYGDESENRTVAEAIWRRAILAEALLERAHPEDLDEALQLAQECAALYPVGYEKGEAQPYLGFRVTGLVGEALAARGKFLEAEPLLLESRTGLTNAMRARAHMQIGFDVQREADERLAWFYERWHAAEPGNGFDREAARRRAELER